MGRSLSLLARLPSLEEDGVTHARDCGCARCDAGFAPSEQERTEARRRWEERRAQAAAERAAARKRQAERIKRAEMQLFVNDQIKVTDDQLDRLRALERRVKRDPRLDELSRLLGEGRSLRESLAEIDREFPPSDSSA
jgi:ATP/maltotriose-dependent transcriptional regulator MalT